MLRGRRLSQKLVFKEKGKNVWKYIVYFALLPYIQYGIINLTGCWQIYICSTYWRQGEYSAKKNYYSYYMHIIYILCDVGVVFLCQK